MGKLCKGNKKGENYSYASRNISLKDPKNGTSIKRFHLWNCKNNKYTMPYEIWVFTGRHIRSSIY